MGRGLFAKVVYGITLREEEADVVYGLVSRLEDSPSRDAAPAPSKPNNENLATPRWVGFNVIDLGDATLLPDGMRGLRYRCFGIDDPLVPLEAKKAAFGADASRTHSIGEWRRFAAWCASRGWPLREPEMLFVTDYD